MGTRHGRQLRMRITIGITAALLAAAAEQARADRRTMIRAYEFQTQPKGNLELELWNDIQAPRSAFADSIVVTRVELEYGITDRLDTALYHVFEQGGPSDLNWSCGTTSKPRAAPSPIRSSSPGWSSSTASPTGWTRRSTTCSSRAVRPPKRSPSISSPGGWSRATGWRRRASGPWT